MKGQVRVIASPAVAAGFRLAGLAAVAVGSASEASAAVQRCVADPACGVLLVEQPLLDGIADSVREALERRPLPLVVPIPVPARDTGTRGPDDYILDLLQQAIGYRVRLQ